MGPTCAGAQSEAGLRPHDRMGPARPARASRRPRHQLHLAHRRAGRDRRRKDKPVPPLNLVGDFGGGALYLVVGVLAALLEAKTIGQGPGGRCRDVRRRGLADVDVLRHGGRPAAGPSSARAISSTAARISTASMNAPAASSSRSARSNRSSTPCCASTPASPMPASTRRWTARRWPPLKKSRRRCSRPKRATNGAAIMEGTDICFAPVLTMKEAPQHPHMAARETFVDPPRRHPARPGAALLAHAVGDPRCRQGRYRRG